jgi:N-acylglucosamine-6-phosphate 2-epimerase
MDDLIARSRGGLIVSAQASASDDPMCDPFVMARVAQAAVAAGAVAIRCGGVGGADHIRAVREMVVVPIIGLIKRAEGARWITPSPADVAPIVAAGADVVAFDAVVRSGDDREHVRAMVSTIHDTGRLAMADIARLDDARHAIDAGADLVATTLAGYLPDALDVTGEPDIALVRELVSRGLGPVVAEGRYHQPQLVREAIDAGAHAVVVGSAITSPGWLTGRFMGALDRTSPQRPAASRQGS